MEIHKPKPIHNWREFLKEYAIIVIGVLTALGAEQAVEWVHWRQQVTEARQVIATELVENLAGAIIRVRTKACAEQRVAFLALTLDAAAKIGVLPPVGDISLPPRTNWPSGAWDSVVASQTATHFPREQLAALAARYKGFQRMEYFSGLEIEAWSSLYAMVGPGRRLDPASEADLRKSLSQALSYTRAMSSLSLQLILHVKALNLPFSREQLDYIAAEEHRDPKVFDICRPLGAAPPSYGQAYSTPVMAGVDEAAKHLPNFSAGASQ